MYSAAAASLSIGALIFFIPHTVIGSVFLLYGLRGRVIIRGASSKLMLLVQIPVGLLFFGAALWSIVGDIKETRLCRNAEAAGNYEAISGRLHIIKRFSKPGYGYVEFLVGERSMRTYEAGPSCDCGYVLPVGRSFRLEDGMMVDLKLFNGKVVALAVRNEG